MRISDWSSDVCSSDLVDRRIAQADLVGEAVGRLHREARAVQRLVQRDIAGGDGARRGMADFLVEAEVLAEIARIGLGRHAAPRLFVLSSPDLIRASHVWAPRVTHSGDPRDMILCSLQILALGPP